MFLDRLHLLRNILELNQIDAFLISNFYNILYLTGFKTLTTDEREAFILVTKTNIYLFTDARYVYTDPGVTLKLIEPGKGLFFHLRTIIENEKIKTLGIESEDLRVHEYEKLRTVFDTVKISLLEKTIMELRAIKDGDEIQNVKKACEITDQCLKEIIPSINIDDPEKKIAFRIEQWIKIRGYDLAFDPIVAVNKNSALPHYHTKDGKGKVERQSVILIDFGVKFQNYMSDITRMIFVKPTQEQLQTYSGLLKTQEKTIKAITLDKNPKDIDSYCRILLERDNLPNFPHSLGHGVGLEIHEYPKISQLSEDTFHNGQVFTIEPGTYFDGKWGVRIEDTVMIRNGRAEILTKYTKKPYSITY